MKKRLSQAGETIVETLFSMLIVSLTFLFLAGAIVSAARVNNRIKTTESDFSVTDAASASGTVEANGESVSVTVSRVSAGQDHDGNEIYYYYYRRNNESGGDDG